MADKLNETVVDKMLDVGNDTSRGLILIASYMDEIRGDITAINERLRKGDETMTAIKSSIDNLPCERPSAECGEPVKSSSWGKTTMISSGIATVIISVVEIVKQYSSKGAN